jgi:hypothetical protein
MKRIAIVLATLAVLVLAAPTASADVANFDLFSGRGTIEKAEIIDAFGWTGKQFNNRAYDVVLRRDVAQSYDISCVTAEGTIYREEFITNYHVYADPQVTTSPFSQGPNGNQLVTNRRGKVTGYVFGSSGTGWTSQQTVDGPTTNDVVIAPLNGEVYCENGDTVLHSTVEWYNGQYTRVYRNEAGEIDFTLNPSFNYQRGVLVAEWNGTSSAVLATL